jgi:hypothetical protein
MRLQYQYAQLFTERLKQKFFFVVVVVVVVRGEKKRKEEKQTRINKEKEKSNLPTQ